MSVSTSTVKIAVPDEDPEFRSKFANLIKINLLLSQANSLLRAMFKERWMKHFGSAWDEDALGNANRFINGIGQRFFRRVGKIQKDALLSGNVENWDIPMFTDILMYVDFDEAPDKLERKHLELLKQVRNKVAHSPQDGISDPDLETLWSKAEQVLLHFGWNAEEIQKLKSSTNVAEFESQNTSTINDKNSKLATKLKEKGNDLYRRKEFEKAIEVYTTAIAMDGLSQVDRGILYSNRSSTYLGLVEQDQNSNTNRAISLENAAHRALEDAKEAIRLRPAWYKGYFRAGSAYHADRKYEKAVRSFDWALSLAPGHEEVQTARFTARMKLGIDVRNENMDPIHNRTNEDMRKKMEERLGTRITDKMENEIKKFNEKRIPGQADVYKGHDYRDGTGGMKQDFEAAARLYTRAVAVGNAEAMYNLALSYKSGRGVQRDFAMAIKLFKEAASKPAFRGSESSGDPVIGVAEAEHSLGLAHEEGVGVSQDYAAACKWYKKGSDHGNSNSSNNLAFMYQDGKGVLKDVKRAGQYWHLSATQQNPLAMLSLATYYLEVERDPVQAQHWHELAIANGNLNAKLHKQEFDSAVATITALEKEIQNLEKWKLESERQPIVSNEEGTANVTESPKLFDLSPVIRIALLGSITAQKLWKAVKNFDAAMGEFKMGLNARTWPKFCASLAESSRQYPQVVSLAPGMFSMFAMLVSNYMKTLPEDVPSKVDNDARMCYIALTHPTTGVTEALLRFVEASKKMYPEEVVFHQLHGSYTAFLDDHNTAMRLTQDSLKLFPGDVDLLYNLASINLSIITKGADEKSPDSSLLRQGVQLYQDFLAAAPKDHSRVPESYYSIALIYQFEELWIAFERDARVKLDRVKKYLQMGTYAEKIQLPIHLPYKSDQKEGLKDFIRKCDLHHEEQGKEMKSVPTSPLDFPVTDQATLFRLLTAPVRVNFIKEHREFAKTCEKELKWHSIIGPPEHDTRPPRHKQAAPASLTGLRPITFKEMNVLKDQVYENRVLAVRSIEDPGDIRRPSIMLILEDENRDACRAFIYNFGVNTQTTHQRIVEQLGYGAKLSIINPYMRLAVDGGYGIRVDDPSTLFLHSGNTPKACRFCGKPDAKLQCGKCKKAFYCGRNCQEVDWRKMHHTLICGPVLFK